MATGSPGYIPNSGNVIMQLCHLGELVRLRFIWEYVSAIGVSYLTVSDIPAGTLLRSHSTDYAAVGGEDILSIYLYDEFGADLLTGTMGGVTFGEAKQVVLRQVLSGSLLRPTVFLPPITFAVSCSVSPASGLFDVYYSEGVKERVSRFAMDT